MARTLGDPFDDVVTVEDVGVTPVSPARSVWRSPLGVDDVRDLFGERQPVGDGRAQRTRVLLGDGKIELGGHPALDRGETPRAGPQCARPTRRRR